MIKRFFVLFLLSLFLLSCDKEVELPEEEQDCRYQFDLDLEDIYGAWEPSIIINLETSDTISYDPGKGHTGFILNGQYADAFELRPDSSITFYYVEYGRFCANRMDGKWYLKQDTIYISRFPGDLKKLHLIQLTESKLIVEDVVNFSFSIASYRKNNF